MHSPSLEHLLVQAHIHELDRSRRASSTKPIATVDRTATRYRDAARLFSHLTRAMERFVGHPGPDAPAVQGRP